MKKKLTSLEFALLGLVEQGETSGYDLCKVFETTPMGHYSASPGSIYPALKRLEKGGFIEGRVDREKSLRPRRLFSLSPDGREALVEWVSRPVARKDIIWAEDELLLRFGFMDALVEREVIVRFLEEVARHCADEIDALERHHRAMKADERAGAPPASGRLALAYGIASFHTLAQWAGESLNEFGAVQVPSKRKKES
jgi:DNA-binding PadR family transcriptional regulator